MAVSEYLPCIAAAATALSERKEEINRLNVFPVPDGDTGTNMSLTIETVVKEAAALPPTATLVELRHAVTHGSLMGARGNSGVITSQILRGLCEGMEGSESFDAAAIAIAFDRAVEVAFHAVRKPVEGTILTVLRDCAEGARRAAEEGSSRDDALKRVSEVAFASVKRTPELLPVLKENNVVDAGGFGLAILIEGFVSAVTGDAAAIPVIATFGQPAAKVAIEQINDWEGSAYRYCTEFLFNSADVDEEAALDFLGTMGDCELLVGSHPDFKVHVHTNDPGTVLSYMTERGQVAEVHIHNMQLQSEARTEGLKQEGVTQPAKPLGFIAVAAGAGTAKILGSLGADYVVNGGQTMNPSTRDLLDAVNSVDAQSVIIFPNNKNIILAANAVASISEKPVAVVPTRSVPQSFAALFVANPEASLEQNVEAMTEAISEVHTGEVTFAIKDATAPDGTRIKDGDVLGISDDSIEFVGSDINQVALDLVGHIAGDDADVLTILAGQDLGQDSFESLLERIEQQFPDLEIDAHRGEQPLYPLVMAAE
ncbi:MAG: DAK2 domain-containing protein [Coriobacteriales bacterium]|jgi:DAK2 domain fusion protein YloV|nr:DAK2 domain-containing protein [Coriobacteriales bacterium]